MLDSIHGGYKHTSESPPATSLHLAMMLRSLGTHKGVYHKMSPKHLQRYVDEFTWRQNVRREDIIDIMAHLVVGLAGKQLLYWKLVADNG